MKSFVHRRGLSFWVAVTSALLLLVTIWIIATNVAFAAPSSSLAGRLVTIYDRGVRTSVVTESLTIDDALKDAGIVLDPSDVVEPGLDEEILSSNYRVNIYRAKPIIVIDGYSKHTIMSPYQTVDRIIEHAGIELKEGDQANLERVNDVVLEGAGLKLTITRAIDFTLILNGQSTGARSASQTVGDMLDEKNITLGAHDTVSPGLDSELTPGLEVVVWREGKQTINVEESINFEVETIQDANRPVGYKQIQTKGQKGLRVGTYEVSVKDGKQIDKKELVSLVVKRPVNQVEVIGIKRDISTTPSENEEIAWNFFISKGFTPQQTAGIMGNLAQEHGFNTSDVAGGLGIAQWLGNRRDNLLNRAEPYSIHTQLEFIIHEFNTTEYRAKNALLAAGTVEQATLVFQNLYERCNPAYCNLERRTGFAYSILARYM